MVLSQKIGSRKSLRICCGCGEGIDIVKEKTPSVDGKEDVEMRRVFKYTVPVEDYFSLEMPGGAKVLTVQNQHGEPQLWALVNPDNPTETRNFRLVGTGHPISENPDMLDYIGTFQLADGAFIGHVFEIG